MTCRNGFWQYVLPPSGLEINYNKTTSALPFRIGKYLHRIA